MKPVRVVIADESPAMRRWYGAALKKVAHDVDECASGWELLSRLAEGPACDLVVASRSLPGLSGVQILAMLRTADAHVPFMLVAPFCDGSVRSMVGRLRSAALIEDPLDAVRLAEIAAALLASGSSRAIEIDKVRRAVAHHTRIQRRRLQRALG